MLSRPITVEPREGYRIWLRYEDGVEGEIDLSGIRRDGMFEVWNDWSFFEKVYISEFDSVAWSDDLELCPNALYMELTGKSVEDLMPSVKALSTRA